MKVLVTGSTGFIGNHVINELLAKKVDVIATSLVEEREIQNFVWGNQVLYKKFDLNDHQINDLYTFFNKPDILIHLAWEGLPNYNELYHFEKNLSNSYIFIKKFIESGVKKVNVIGTCLEYGLKDGKLSEDFNTSPITAYGLAKDTLRKFLEQLKSKWPFCFNWIRLFYLYGKGQNPRSLLANLETAILNGEKEFNMSYGEQIRDYLPIEEVAKNIVNISMSPHEIGIINCCSGKPISVRKLAEDFVKKMGSGIKLNLGQMPYPSYEPFAFWGDNSKLKSLGNGK